ncbi:hypothetical protein E3P96_02395 [Wallemia ichthyophaga]|nr:hypothetical protein E3P96_02395 [Wallemia ichthyophaga]
MMVAVVHSSLPRTSMSTSTSLDHLSQCDSIISSILIDLVWGFNVVKPAQCRLDLGHSKDTIIDIVSRLNYNTARLDQGLLELTSIKDYLRRKRILFKSLFKDHLHVYTLLFHPSTPFEVCFNRRLSSLTHKEEYSLIATKNITSNTPVKNCLATLTKITPKQDQILTDSNNDWSVLTSLSSGTRIFLGPARFANHDCNNNCQLQRTKDHINLVTIRCIRKGDEILLNYGPHYFGENNEKCFCRSCEAGCKGAFRHANSANSVNSPVNNQLRTRFNSYIRSSTNSSTNHSRSRSLSSASSSLTPLSSAPSCLDEMLCQNNHCTNEKLPDSAECYTCDIHRRIYKNSWPMRSRPVDTIHIPTNQNQDSEDSAVSEDSTDSDFMSE